MSPPLAARRRHEDIETRHRNRLAYLHKKTETLFKVRTSDLFDFFLQLLDFVPLITVYDKQINLNQKRFERGRSKGKRFVEVN